MPAQALAMAGAGNADLRSSTLWVGKYVQGSVEVRFRFGCGSVMFDFVDGVLTFGQSLAVGCFISVYGS